MSRMTELASFLKTHDDYAVFGHVNPDGDAIGSCIALAEALIALGKRAFVYLPGGCTALYSEFKCSVTIAGGNELPFEPKTALSVDVSDPGRFGSGEVFFNACPAKAMLDHHGTNPCFGDVYVVDGQAAACGELAVELISELNVTMTKEMGMWLYIAISTDCGQFGFSSTRAETLEAAAECVRTGIDVDRITRAIYRTRSEGRTRLLGTALSRLRLNDRKDMCWSYLLPEDYAAAGALPEDNEGIVNYLVEIRGVEFACLAEERGKDQVKFSLRSKERVDVAGSIAKPIGGGGHCRAAGVTLKMPIQDALDKVLTMADNLLKEHE